MLKSAMSSFRIRPHFVHEESKPSAQFQNEIVRYIEDEEDRVHVKTFPDYLTLVIPEEDQHFWSPQLNLSLDPTEGGGTKVTGTYGPNTNVWSMYLYGYLIGFCCALVSTVFGVSKWIVSGWTTGFYLMGVSYAVLFGLYLSAQIGQKLAAQQTFELHQAFERGIGQHIVIS